VTTQEEHHVTHFGHSEGGVEIEEVSIIFCGANPFAGVECSNIDNSKKETEIV
jgi:hypothetical protein